MLVRPFLRRMMVLGAGIAAGSLLMPSSANFQAVADGSCEAFAGIGRGNDPSQTMTLHLCRSGDDVWGLKNSAGVAGSSSFRLEGKINNGTLSMRIHDVVSDQPQEGWHTCYDDEYAFRWDGEHQQLVGHYDSAECDDHAELVAARMTPDLANSWLALGTELHEGHDCSQ